MSLNILKQEYFKLKTKTFHKSLKKNVTHLHTQFQETNRKEKEKRGQVRTREHFSPSMITSEGLLQKKFQRKEKKVYYTITAQ